jgi:gliding motility-associated-like protein
VKKIIYTLSLIFLSTNLFASHGMGGEITWTCSGTSYIFKVKFYRDCNGIPGPGSITLTTNVPGVPNILCNLTSQADISPDGSAGTGNTNCPTCTSGGNGAVEEFVFLSAPIVLPGTPPAGGWAFWWGDCCRSGALTNLANGGSLGFGLRAKMYPYPGFIAGQCHDNSPYFAEKPSTIICTGYQFTYNHNAVDAELDSVVYAWDSPIDNVNYPWTPPIPYQAPYSVSNQLPGSPTLNIYSGELTYNPPTGGYFVTVIKATAYKCGVIAAEIWREINVVLISGCSIPTAGNPKNFPPSVPFPINLPSNVPWTSNSDTVIAGDTVKFALSATDFDIHPPNLAQIITFTASGNEYGAGYSSQVAGCVIPPCATLTPPPPVSSPALLQETFYWRTTCGHVKGLDTMCTRISNTYTFIIKANDDFCPANGISISTIRITVKRPPKLLPPKIKCASVINKFGDVTLSWAPPSPRDTHATFADYEIWASTNAAGPYVLVDSVYGGLNQYFTTSKTIPNARQTTLLGTHAQNTSLYFKMYTRCGCDSDSISIASNIVRTMKPVATPGGGGTVNVNWNPVHNPQIATSGDWYYIWKEYPIGTWTLIDSTTTVPAVLTYNDPSTVSICDDTITYRIATNDDSLNCTSWSAYAGIHLINNAPVSNITPGNPAFCNGQNVVLTANPGNATTYQWSTGATTQTITSSTAQTYTVTLTFMPGGCTSTSSTTTSVIPLPTANIAGSTSICAGQNTNIILIFTGTGPWNYSYNTPSGVVNGSTAVSPVNIAVAPSSTFNYTLASVTTGACAGNISGNANIVVNTIPSATLSGTTAICTGQNAYLTVTFANGPGPYTFTYNPGAVVVNTASNPYVFLVNPASTTNYTLVSMSNANCTGTIIGNAVVTVNALPVPVISGNASFCVGNATTLNAGAGYSNYIWSNGATTQTVNINTAGTFTATVTNANGCTGSVSKTTVVNPLPVPNITGITSICQGATTTFDAGAGYSSYVWSTGSGGQMLNIGIAGTYTVTVTDANGCTGSDNINLAVNALPTPAITGVSTFCQGGSSTLNAGGPYTNYLWSTGATTQTLSVNSGGNYIVTVTNGFGCTASTNQVVVVNALPVPVIAGNASFCVGSATTLNAGAGYSNYIWSNGVTTQTVNINTAGTFTATVTNANGCTGSASKTTIINPLPTPNVTGTTSICQGTSTTFDAGAGYSSYVWSTGSGGQTLNMGIAGTYTVTVTDANGCTGSDNINLTVNPLPVPAITGNNDFCQGNSSTLNAGAGFTNYLWSNAATTQTINVNASGNYVVTVTNGFNCTASTNLLVTVHALPNPVITGGTGICQGTFTILNAGNNYANYSWSTGETTQTINVNTGGNYTVSVTDINGCTNTSSTTMIVNPLPTPAVTGNNVVCQGVSTTFDAGAGYSSYVWSTGAGGQTINTGISGTYTVTVTDVNGCTGSDNINLTVNPLPVPAITGNNVFCQGNSSILNAGAGFNSYSWSTGSSAQNISVNTSGWYVVTVTNNFGCSASAHLYVTVNQLPTPAITGGTGICFGGSTTLDAGNGYSNYEWSIGATTQTIVATNAGNYTVTVTDNNGCVNSANTTMIVNALPTPVITGNTAICQGTFTTFDAGTGYNSYVWSTGSGSQMLNATIAGLYTVTVTDANGCTNSDSINLVVNALPTPAISGNTVLCQGNTTTLNAGAGYTSYAWSNSSTAQTINTGNAGMYSVTVYDGNGCSASTSVNIVVNPLPNPVISGTSAICSGTTSTLNTGNYSSFLWSTGETTQSISTGDSGNYTVTVTDLNGCIDSSQAFNLVVYSLPSAAISQNSAICIGGSSSFNISFIGTPPFHYIYNDGNQNSAWLTSLTSTATINVTPSDTTTYTLVSVTDLHCLGYVSGSAVVTVNPLPTPAITGTNVICDGNSTIFSADGGYNKYLWSTTETTSSITLTDAGNYTVTVTDGNGCVSSTSQTLIVNETPVAAFSNDTSLTCAEPIIHFFDNSTYPPGSSFLWNFGDGDQSTEINPSHTFTQAGTFPIVLTITSPLGCVGTTTKNTDIQFYPLPVAEFKTDPAGAASVFNSSVNFFDRSQNAVTWNWNFGDGGNAIEQNPKHYYDEIGKFKIQLTVTNIAGCVSRAEEEIIITPFYVPNAFTPNGDGMNDAFFNSDFVMDVASFNMTVWNRWGQKVFDAQNINQSWNGFDKNGKEVAQGSYVYQIKVVTKTNKKYSYEGSVTLLR